MHEKTPLPLFRLPLNRESGLDNIDDAISHYNRLKAGSSEIIFSKSGRRMSLFKTAFDDIGCILIKLTAEDLISILENIGRWCYEIRTPRALYYRSTWRSGIPKRWTSIILNALPAELPSVRVILNEIKLRPEKLQAE